MKKVLSVILTLIMIVSVFAVIPLRTSALENDIAATGESYTMSVGDTKTLYLDNPYSSGFISSASWSSSNSYCVSIVSSGNSSCTVKANNATSSSVTISCSYVVRVGSYPQTILNCSQKFYITVSNSSGGSSGGGSSTTQYVTVYFDANGGTVTPSSKQLEAGSGVRYLLPHPYRDGYTFDGWYTSRNGGSSVNTISGAQINRSITLYAHWTPNTTYNTLTFDPNGGTVSPTSKQFTSGSSVGSLPTPYCSGYNFEGWYTSRYNGTRVYSTTTLYSDTTVYAHWSSITTPTEKPTQKPTEKPTQNPTEPSTIHHDKGVWIVADGVEYEVKQGQVINYVYYLNTGEKVCSIDAETFFDTSGLELVSDTDDLSSVFPILKDAVILNDNVTGRLKYNFSSSKGKDFNTDDSKLITIQFKVTSDKGVYNINTYLHTVCGVNEHIYIFKDAHYDDLKRNEGILVGLRSILGDADGDKELTILDATRIQRWLAELCDMDGGAFTGAKLTDREVKVADADEDKDVTIMDATAIQRHIADLPTNQNIGNPIK